MARLDTERQKALEPKRMEYAKQRITALGLEIVYEDSTRIDFLFNGAKIQFYPYSGWHTGKTVKDGRGIQNLLKQLSRKD